MSTIIEIKNAVKIFGKQKALGGISACFEEGKIYGLIGRNGSGKTVLMKCICGLTYLDSGEILIDNKPIKKDRPASKTMGVIIETPGFLGGYSGYKNLKFLADINNKIDKQKILDTIEFVGLDPTSNKQVRKYSLGMRQRLGIAQAIMEDPDILLLDEPMNGLDNQGVVEIRELLLKLKEQGKTIILASHNKEDIAVLCDSVIELDHGEVIARY